MTWRGFFEGIQSFFESVAFAPYNWLRSIETDNWWGANLVSWALIVIGLVAFVYWMGQLKKFEDSGEEDKSITAHKYLG
jgi:hypothetical protein